MWALDNYNKSLSQYASLNEICGWQYIITYILTTEGHTVEWYRLHGWI